MFLPVPKHSLTLESSPPFVQCYPEMNRLNVRVLENQMPGLNNREKRNSVYVNSILCDPSLHHV